LDRARCWWRTLVYIALFALALAATIAVLVARDER
jgi:hypothetical protein